MKYCCQYIDDYLDGELSKDQLSKFQDALASCQECQLAIESAESFNELLREGWDNIEVPDFEPFPFPEPTIKNELPKKGFHSGSPRENRWMAVGEFGMLAVAATLLIVIGGMIYLLGQGLNPQPVPNQSLADQNVRAKEKSNPRNRKSESKDLTSENSGSDSDQAQSDAAIAKAIVEFPDNYLGVRVDEPDEDFTFIHVYETVNPRSFESKDPPPFKKENNETNNDAA